jgi:glyoxylase-like metal-dependent hydrolase (beta-lactamase superfamily II)
VADQRQRHPERLTAAQAELAPGVHRLGDSMVNFYLVEDQAGITMVDAGLPGHYAQLTGFLARLGRPVTDVRAILITHAHPDHTGLAERIRAESGATVWVHPADQPILADPRHIRRYWKAERSLLPYALRRPATVAVPLHLARQGGFRPRPVMQMTTISPGQVLDVPGQPRAIGVPGHTRGSSAFVFPGHGVLFTGDALVTYDAITGQAGPRLVARAFTQDSRTALASLGALAVGDTAVILPGHGQPYTGGLASAVAHARQAGLS